MVNLKSFALVVVLTARHILGIVAGLGLGVEHAVDRAAAEPREVVGEDAASEEGTAVRFSRKSSLSHRDRALESIEFLSSAPWPVSRVGVLTVSGSVLEHQMVLAGDQPLYAAGAVNVLVTSLRHWPFTVKSQTTTSWLGFLKLGSSGAKTINLEWEAALLADRLVNESVLAQKLSSEL